METIDSNGSPSAVAESSRLFNHALKWGGIMGAIAVIMSMLVYVVDYSLLADWKTGIFFLLIFIGIVIYAGINYRKQVGGFLTYGKAFQHGFATLAVAGLINVIFMILLHNVIDPDLPQNLTDVTVEKTSEMLQGFGMPEDKVDEQIDKMREEMPQRFSPTGQLISYLWGLILYVIISAITSLFVRKNVPETF